MNHQFTRAVSTLIASALLLAACGDRPDGAAVDERVLRRGNGGDPQSLDPALAEDTHAFAVLGDLYEGLLTVDAEGAPVPGVAESWVVSEDGLTYTFHLRPASWSNGQPVRSADFAEAWRRVVDPATASAYSFLLMPIANAEAIIAGELPPTTLGIETPDERTLRVQLRSPTPYFLSVMTMPIAAPVYQGSRVDSSRFRDPSHFVGNGPFQLASWQPGGVLRLSRNPVFHASESVAIDVVEFLPLADPFAELNMFRAGELHITATVPTSMIDTLREELRDELRIAPHLALYYIAFDLTEPPTDNVDLRRALSMAIDREALVRVIGRGEQPAYGLVPDGVAAYSPSRFTWHSLDSEQRRHAAKALYKSAGYAKDRPLQLSLLYDAGDIHETVAVAVSSMWRDVLGAEVSLDKREWQYFLATRDQRDEWQAMRFAWSGDYNHPATFTGILHSNSPQNLPKYSNDGYDRLLAKAGQTADRDEQMRLYAAAEALMLEDSPIAPLYFFVSKHLVAAEVAGFRDNVMDLHPSRYLKLAVTATQ